MKRARAFFCVILLAPFLSAASIHTPAPGFSLVNLHNEKRTLSDYKGKVVFINFWASWCAPCQQELPELARLAADYKGKRVRVVAINVDEDRAAAKKLMAKLHLDAAVLEILWDTKSKAVSAYNIESMPSSFVLDSKGVIQYIHSGFHDHDPQTWRQEIDRLLPSRPQTK